MSGGVEFTFDTVSDSITGSKLLSDLGFVNKTTITGIPRNYANDATAGTITINGETININANSTIEEIADKITMQFANSMNPDSISSGITASRNADNQLEIKANPGVTIVMNDGTSNALSKLGMLTQPEKIQANINTANVTTPYTFSLTSINNHQIFIQDLEDSTFFRSAQNRLETLKINNEKMQGDATEVDMTEIITKLQTMQTIQSAALKITAQVTQLSLMNFLS